MAKKAKSMTSQVASRVLTDGETRDTAMPPVIRKALAKPKRKPYVGGNVPPVPPVAADTPLAPKRPVQTHAAIGERPVQPRTAAKMARMKKGY